MCASKAVDLLLLHCLQRTALHPQQMSLTVARAHTQGFLFLSMSIPKRTMRESSANSSCS